MSSSESRLPAGLEVAALLRRTEIAGDFATVLHRGDKDRGALLLIIGSRGRHVACVERVLALNGAYEWRRTGPDDSAGSAEITSFVRKRAQFDEDFWAIELDIADPERFIAEIAPTG
ncbi:MAG: DUF1491 family protein [Sphingomicrobium sp.]